MEQDKKSLRQVYDRVVIKRMLTFAKPYWYLFAIALILIFAVTGASLARPYITKIGIDKYMTGYSDGTMSAQQASKGIWYLGILFLALIIVEFVFNYLQHYILELGGKEDNKGY